jgi:hypothetical protein
VSADETEFAQDDPRDVDTHEDDDPAGVAAGLLVGGLDGFLDLLAGFEVDRDRQLLGLTLLGAPNHENDDHQGQRDRGVRTTGVVYVELDDHVDGRQVDSHAERDRHVDPLPQVTDEATLGLGDGLGLGGLHDTLLRCVGVPAVMLIRFFKADKSTLSDHSI